MGRRVGGRVGRRVSRPTGSWGYGGRECGRGRVRLGAAVKGRYLVGQRDNRLQHTIEKALERSHLRLRGSHPLFKPRHPSANFFSAYGRGRRRWGRRKGGRWGRCKGRRGRGRVGRRVRRRGRGAELQPCLRKVVPPDLLQRPRNAPGKPIVFDVQLSQFRQIAQLRRYFARESIVVEMQAFQIRKPAQIRRYFARESIVVELQFVKIGKIAQLRRYSARESIVVKLQLGQPRKPAQLRRYFTREPVITKPQRIQTRKPAQIR